jgi:RNA polymerase sigma-70 factor (ECF subfamily)
MYPSLSSASAATTFSTSATRVATLSALRIDAATSDAALVERLIADCPAAWREFSRRFGPLMYRSISRVLNRFSYLSEDDCQEVYSTLCLQLLSSDKKKLRSYDQERGTKLSTWLGMLANHAAYDHLRRRRREPNTEDLDCADTLTAERPSPFERCALNQQAARVASLLSDLSDKDREFMVLYYGEGLEAEQVALEMGISVKTVYSKKHKIRAKLANIVGQHEAA